MRLDDKVAIVTGAGRGIGRGIALSLAKEGANVVVSDVNITSAEKVAEEVKALGCQALAVKADVSKSEEVKRMVRATLKKFVKIDILVNNAGITRIADVVDLEEEDWDAVLNVNAKGTFLCSKYVAPHMIKRKSGKIINISSVAGKTGSPGRVAYCSSKFAVVGFTQVLERELGKYNINVNAICPGMVWTKMQEYLDKERLARGEKSYKESIASSLLGRDQTPEDIGNAVVFLASEESKNITGQSINVDGGSISGTFH